MNIFFGNITCHFPWVNTMWHDIAVSYISKRAKTGQWDKARSKRFFATKSNDLNLVPRAHVVEEQKQFPQAVLQPLWMHHGTHRHLSLSFFLSLSFQHWDYEHRPPGLAFMWLVGTELRSSCLHIQHFTDWIISPAPRSVFKKRHLRICLLLSFFFVSQDRFVTVSIMLSIT